MKDFTKFLLLCSVAIGGCGLLDDDQPSDPDPDGDTDGGPTDNEVCIAAIESIECDPGTNLTVLFDGGTASVTLIDDPGAAVGILGGFLVDFGSNADWIATSLTQNSVCSVFCAVPGCPDGQSGCFANPSMDVSCSFCAPSISEQGCIDFIEACMPDDDGGTGGTGGADGGADGGTGGADSGSSGGSGIVYDCSGWDPAEVIRSNTAYSIPQTMVDDLVLHSGEPLSECDGVRFSEGNDGYYYISEMGPDGLLQRLGIKKGAELTGIDGQDLDGTDVLAKILVEKFYEADGKPKQFGRRHPGFSLRFEHRNRTRIVPVRVDPSR